MLGQAPFFDFFGLYRIKINPSVYYALSSHQYSSSRIENESKVKYLMVHMGIVSERRVEKGTATRELQCLSAESCLKNGIFRAGIAGISEKFEFMSA
ncbi:hypothetical protein [Burkholderia thailandensis]|uniref:hypothetical protein n=1 Tax=Burkholderia thailandensis TaxID=57975 RepID=UPI0011868BA5|nr:hypothetical protein [Burkholderia thailandensis]